MTDYFGYNDKVAVVTDSSSGMGKAATNMLVDLGAKVYVLDWADCDVEGITGFMHTDLSQKESIDTAFEKLPDHIDNFFGIVGVSGIKTDFNKTTIIDFIANQYICEEHLIHRMTNGGAIAFITSMGGWNWEREGNKKYILPLINAKGWEEKIKALEALNMNSLPGALGYTYAKMAMNYYTAYLQQIFASQGIRVNSLLSGSTNSGMIDEFTEAAGGMDSFLTYTGHEHRLATPEEMGEPVVFLNSDMARYISGELLVVDYDCGIEKTAGITKDHMGMDEFTFDLLLQSINKE